MDLMVNMVVIMCIFHANYNNHYYTQYNKDGNGLYHDIWLIYMVLIKMNSEQKTHTKKIKTKNIDILTQNNICPGFSKMG